MSDRRELERQILDAIHPWNEAWCRRCGWPIKARLEDGCTKQVCRLVTDDPAFRRADTPPDISSAGIFWPIFEEWLREGRHDYDLDVGFDEDGDMLCAARIFTDPDTAHLSRRGMRHSSQRERLRPERRFSRHRKSNAREKANLNPPRSKGECGRESNMRGFNESQYPLLWQDENRMAGRVCIRGTRIPVYCVLQAMAQYDGDARRAYKDLTDAQIFQALWYAAEFIQETELPPIDDDPAA